MKKKAFTLMELLLVLSIMGILSLVLNFRAEIIPRSKEMRDMRLLAGDIEFARDLAIGENKPVRFMIYEDNKSSISYNDRKKNKAMNLIEYKNSYDSLKSIYFVNAKNENDTFANTDSIIFSNMGAPNIARTIKARGKSGRDYYISVEVATGKVNLK